MAVQYAILWDTWTGHGAVAIGGLIAAAIVVSQVTAAVVAAYSDHVGRRGVLILGGALITLGVVTAAVSLTGYVAHSIVVGYLMVQAGFAVTNGVAVAHVSDLAGNHNRRLAMSAYGIVVGLGFTTACAVAAMGGNPAIWVAVVAASMAGVAIVVAQPRLIAASFRIPRMRALHRPLYPQTPSPDQFSLLVVWPSSNRSLHPDLSSSSSPRSSASSARCRSHM